MTETIYRFCRGKQHLGINPVPIAEFYPSTDNRDKLRYSCKTCDRESGRRSEDRRREGNMDAFWRRMSKKAK